MQESVPILALAAHSRGAVISPTVPAENGVL